MRCRITLLTPALLVSLGVAACADAPTEPAPVAESPPPGLSTTPAVDDATTTGRHLVVFRRSRGVPASFDTQVAALGGKIELEIAAIGVATVSGLDAGAVRALARSHAVLAVEPEGLVPLPAPLATSAPEAGDPAPASPSDPTTATRFPRQWNMLAIDAPGAWSAGFLGSPDVTVAILDTGIDYAYPDLAGRVDLSRSVSFVPSDDALVATFFPGKHPVTDLHFHGTHVAATAVSNAFVVAGVTSGSTLIGVKVCHLANTPSGASCPIGATFAGIVHAADVGADVINLSLGGAFLKRLARGGGGFPALVAGINRVFNYAGQRGVTVVVAAGNESLDLDHLFDLYQAYCDAPHVVCVSATGPTSAAGVDGPWQDVDAFAPYSNFGRSAVTVAAPGGNAGGLVWSACSQTSLLIPVCRGGTFILGIVGTSMASPHAAGVAALLVGEVGPNRPSRVKSLLQRTADDLGQPGTDPLYGTGRVNAANAVH